MTAAARPRTAGNFLARLVSFDDGAIIRAAFFLMLAGTGAVLWLDYGELTNAAVPELAPDTQPILPAFDPDSPDTPAGPEVTTDPALLGQPLSAILTGGGMLALTGTIDVGAAGRVTAEIIAHGEYIKTVALNSPGGSVADALAIGQLIRVKGFTTSVAAGAICASSCPLIFAGGAERLATDRSAIGVHQIYAAAPAGPLQTRLEGAANAMSDAQKTTAEITRYLEKMGIGSEVWLHALETPPDRLYYFSPEEMSVLKLVTKLTR